MGRQGDGGKWICNPHWISSSSRSTPLVYSLGSNSVYDFEEAINQHFDGQVVRRKLFACAKSMNLYEATVSLYESALL